MGRRAALECEHGRQYNGRRGTHAALAFFAACHLAKPFLQAMAGVASMTVAINPADNSLIVVIETSFKMQQTTLHYPARVVLVWLRGAAIVNEISLTCRTGLACVQYASSPSSTIENGCSIETIHALNCRLTSSDLTTYVAIARLRIIRAHCNKRFPLVFPKADNRPNIRNAPFPIRVSTRSVTICLEAAALPTKSQSLTTNRRKISRNDL